MIPMTAEKEKAPVDDKLLIQAKTQQVLDELAKADGFKELIQKGLKSMTHKQFISILQLFLKPIVGSVQFDSTTYVDYISNFLISVDYPYPMNKASLKTPSAPHCQNSIILLLAWISEFSTVPESENEYCTTDDFSTPDISKVFMQKTSEAFILWNNQQESESDEAIEQIRQTYIEKNIGAGVDLDTDIFRLKEQIDQLKKEAKPDSQQNYYSERREELKKLRKKTEELEKTYRAMCDEVLKAQKKLELKQLAETDAFHELEVLRHKISKQKMSIQEKNNMLIEVSQLSSLLASKKSAAMELCEASSANDIQLSNLIQKKFHLIEKLNNFIYKLSSELEIAGLGGNFNPTIYKIETKKTGGTQKLEKELEQLIQGLNILKEKYQSAIGSVNQNLMKLEAEKHQLITENEMLEVDTEKIKQSLHKVTVKEASLEGELPRVSHICEQSYQETVAAFKQTTANIETLEKVINELKDANKQIADNTKAFKAQSVQKIRSLCEKRKLEVQEQRQKVAEMKKVVEEFNKTQKPFPENVQRIIDQVIQKRKEKETNGC